MSETKVNIPKDLESIAQEARKYKDVDEFISAITIMEARKITDRTLYKWSPKYALQVFYSQALKKGTGKGGKK